MDLNLIFLIISVSISVLGIIYSIISTFFYGKKKTSVKYAKILQALPGLIQNAENLFTTESCGPAKLAYVLNQIHVMCVESHLDFSEDDWRFEIEDILDTPQSHNECLFVDNKVTQ